MAITTRQIWNDYVFNQMRNRASQLGGLFANGVTRLDTAPAFKAGDIRHRVPLVDDLDTLLGATDQRLVDGTDLTVASIDGDVMYAPIVGRGDAIGQSLTSQVKMGTDALASLAPQIADRNLNQMEYRLGKVIDAAFGASGCLASSHVYGNGSAALSHAVVKKAGATTMGDRSEGLTTLIVNSLVEADLYARSMVTHATVVSAGNPTAFNTGVIPMVGGAKLQVNDRICTLIEHTMTGATDDLITVAAGHGFEAGREVVFTGADLPAGLTAGTTYYVIATGLTATAFSVSATLGGSAVDITDTGSGTMTVSGGQYRSYLVGQNAFYVGVQRDIDLTEYVKHLDGGKKFVRYWTLFYAPTIDGISYTASTENPTDANLATASDWSLVKPAHEVKVVQLRNVIADAQNA